MSLNNEIKKIEQKLIKKQERFDNANLHTRDIIRNCAKAITLLHNGEIVEANNHIEKARKESLKIKPLGKEFSYITTQAYQELAEATVFYSIKTKKTIPSFSSVHIESEPYLLGLMDVVGELKREILISLRENNPKAAKQYLSFIEKIYDHTRSIRFAEAILPSFRKKQDVARIQLESSSSDLLRFLKN